MVCAISINIDEIQYCQEIYVTRFAKRGHLDAQF